MTATRLNFYLQHPGGIALAGMFVFLFLGLSACAGVTATPTVEPFRPLPPPLETPTPPAASEELVKPVSTPVCLDNLTWIGDITIPDGTEVGPNSTLDKRWEIKNSGNCNWDERYRLRLIAGPAMNAPQEQALYPARAGTNAVLQIVLQAPADPGKYRSAWQSYNPDGQPFGDPIFIEIVIP
jgi:hypothetical protein